VTRNSSALPAQSAGIAPDRALRLDWFHARAEGPVFLREATQVKNIWIPYGE
jgi:hypothetical protein